MRIIAAFVFLILLLNSTAAIAAERITLQNGDGTEIGTVSNPLYVESA